jgi:DNA helicase-2/ATP-dependent DNA helicase PcrA
MKVDFSKTTSTDLESEKDAVGFNPDKALDLALEGLTDVQRSAVVAPPAPLLILAGAGTGKTKCLVSRIAYKIATGERLPSQILAMTFTRKAASQMKRRLAQMIGPTAQAMDIGTFHATCARILRQHADFAALDPHFTVFDTDDQKHCLKEIIGDNEYASNDILRDIERYKTDVCLADGPWNIIGKYDDAFIQIADAYMAACQRANALDYTDIIVETVRLFRDAPRVAEWRRQTWSTILVDEYQDTNPIQEAWLDLLSPPETHADLTCVGDDDQSIYAFRAADVANILNFGVKRPDATIIRLEQNFRSSSDILDHANRIISHNVERHGKTLYTTRREDSCVQIITAPNAIPTDEAECEQLVARIRKLLADGAPAGEIAVISRTALTLQKFQYKLATAGIPFTVTAGRKFTETSEIRQIVAHLRLMMNPSDDQAFITALNSKKRKFGKTSQERMTEAAHQAGVSYTALLRGWIADDKFKGDKLVQIQSFVDFIDGLVDAWDLGAPVRTITQMIEDDIGMSEKIQAIIDKAAVTKDATERRSLERKAAAIRERLDQFYAAAQDKQDFAEFLDTMTLNDYDESEENSVWLGTIHGAKGLEFDHVLLPAWEPELFPSIPNDFLGLSDEKQRAHIEEERRLAYVAITRARRSVVITHSLTPRMHIEIRRRKRKEPLPFVPDSPLNRSEFIEELLAG